MENEGQPSGGGGVLRSRFGPLPVWVWLALVTALLLGYWLLTRNKQPSTPAPPPEGTAQVPETVNQIQVTVPPEEPDMPTTPTDDDDDGHKPPPKTPPPTRGVRPHPSPNKPVPMTPRTRRQIRQTLHPSTRHPAKRERITNGAMD